MSFTIKCDNCGAERKLEDGSKRRENGIDIWGQYNFDVGIDCENCNENVLSIDGRNA